MDLHVAAFRENGLLLLKGLLAREDVERVRTDAKNVFRIQLGRHDLLRYTDWSEQEFDSALYEYFRRNPQELKNCGKQIQHLISLHQLSLDGRFIDVFHELDIDSIVVWRPLVDVDVELGALEVVPGSHKLGLLTDEVIHGFGKTDSFADSDFRPIEVEQGDALFFSSFLVHRSGTHRAKGFRWSCLFPYVILSEPTFIARGYRHSFIYQPVPHLITPDFPKEGGLQRLFPSREPQSLLG